MHAKPLSDRKFGFVFAVVFVLIAGLVWLINGSWQYWAMVVALAFALLALAAPMLLMPLNRLWMRFGHRLGMVTNALLLGTFFYAMITPFGIVMRMVSSDPMQRRSDDGTESYFMRVRRQASRDTLSDMF
jgi:hypothetical protein